MIIRLFSHKKAAVGYLFDNGNHVSIIFGWATYSDNHDLWDEIDRYESTTVEIMVSGKDSFVKWFSKKYGDNPAGYIPVSEITSIMKRADSKAYRGANSSDEFKLGKAA